MNIGFDAKRIYHNKTGLGNYGRDLVRIMTNYFADNHYFLFNPYSEKDGHFLKQNQCVAEINPTGIGKLFPSIWRSYWIGKDLRKLNIGLFHGLSNEIPFGISNKQIKIVVTIHDLIFLRFPHLYSPIDRWIYTKKYHYACQHADVIIAISQQTKSDIVNFLNIDENKIKVVYQGCHALFQKTLDENVKQAVRQKFRLPKKFLLAVGTIEERKNILTVIKAIQPLKHVHLVMVGKEKDYAESVFNYIKAHNLSNRIHHLKEVKLDELCAIYQLALIFVYPSLFEGFGIPIIEALFSGVPVITSEGSCFAEAGGPSSIYLPPQDIDQWRTTIDNLWNEEGKKMEMIKDGRRFVQAFLDESIAKRLFEVYSELLPSITER